MISLFHAQSTLTPHGYITTGPSYVAVLHYVYDIKNTSFYCLFYLSDLNTLWQNASCPPSAQVAVITAMKQKLQKENFLETVLNT